MRKCRAHDSSEDDVDWVVPAVSDLAGGDDGGDANMRSDSICVASIRFSALLLLPCLGCCLVDSADCLGGCHPEWR
jgi:hypothetical protein